MTSARRSLGRSGELLAGLVLCAGLASTARGQEAAASGANAQETRSFEVATIKLHPPGPRVITIGGPPGRFEATNVTAKRLVAMASHLPEEEISGGPEWDETQRFDVEAKIGDSEWQEMKNLTRGQKQERMREMMAALMRDRFQMAVHHESREMKVYALAVAKGGPKLQPAGSPDPPKPPNGPTRFVMGVDFASAPLSALADYLSDYFGRTVVDQTGLEGNYHIRFNVPMPDESGSAAMETAVLEAVQDQLGLKLESTRAVVDTVVIDRLEEPSEN